MNVLGEKPTTPCVLRPVKGNRYAKFWINGETVAAHRAVVAAVHGWAAIEGRFVEHACDNKNCVRYSHLRIGGPMSNVTDMMLKGRNSNGNDRKTHCGNGHPLAGDNLRIEKGGRRRCLACERDRSHRRWGSTAEAPRQ